MRKIYSIIAPALLVAASVSAVVSLPYASGSFDADIAGALSDDGWSQYDALGTSSWKKDPSRFKYNSQCSANLGNPDGYQSDDWLISPAFAITAGNDYTIEFVHRSMGATLPQKFTVYLTTVSPISDAAAAAAAPSQEAANAIATAYVSESLTFRATSTGQAYFAIRYAGEQRNNIFVADVNITETVNAVTPPVVDPDPQPDHECAGIQTPYISNIALSSTELDPAWEVINNNGDSKTWAAASDGAFDNTAVANYPYNGSQAADDYLISPALHLDAGKEYRLRYNYKNQGNYAEVVTVYASTGKTPDEILTGKVLKKHEEKTSAMQNVDISFTAEATQDLYFVFHCTSPKDLYNVHINGFELLENIFTPSAVGNLKATLGADRAVEITLDWTLPATDVFGDAIAEDKTFDKIEIYRDGAEAPVATLAGTATEWTDTPETGLTPGKHTYDVVVTVAGTASAKATVATGYCGPIAPSPIPAVFPISTEDEFNMYLYPKGPEAAEGSNWEYKYQYGAGFARLNIPGGSVEDHWMVTPPVAIAQPGYYRVTVNCELDFNHPAKLDAYVGTDTKVADMTYIANIPIAKGQANRSFDFYAAEAGTYYAAFHACHPVRTAGQNYLVYSVAVDNSKFYPAAVTDLVATPAADDALAIEASWTAPTKSSAGTDMSDADYTIDVMMADTVAVSFPGGTNHATIPVEKPGVYTITVVTKSASGDAVDAHPSATTTWVGPKLVGVPYTINFAYPDETLNIWEVIDANEDGKTWSYSNQIVLDDVTAVDGKRQYDDIILSPYMDLTPGYYKFRYQMKGGQSYSKFLLTLGLINAGTFDPADRKYIQSKEQELGENYLTWFSWDVEIVEAGRYQFVLSIGADQPNVASYYMPALHDFEVSRTKVLATPAEEVTVTPDADKALEATVSWLNPTTTNVGKTLAEGDIIKAEVLRDGKIVGTITEGLVPGATSTFLDADIDLPGSHRYRVDLYTEDGGTFGDNVYSPWIGGGLPTPYVASYFVSGNTEFENWTVVDIDGNTNWRDEPYTFVYNSYTHRMDISSTTYEADDWAISRPVSFEKDCIYKVKVGMFHNNTFDHTPEAMPIGIHVSDPEAILESQPTFTLALSKESKFIEKIQYDSIYVQAIDPAELIALTADEAETEDPGTGAVENPSDGDIIASAVKIPAGTLKVGVHVPGYKCSLSLAHAEVQMIERIDTGVEGISVDGDMNYADGIFTFDGAADVRVYNLAGALVATETATDSYSIRGCRSGIYIVRITPATGHPAAFKVIR